MQIRFPSKNQVSCISGTSIHFQVNIDINKAVYSYVPFGQIQQFFVFSTLHPCSLTKTSKQI